MFSMSTNFHQASPSLHFLFASGKKSMEVAMADGINYLAVVAVGSLTK
jgi:hypothetical protein